MKYTSLISIYLLLILSFTGCSKDTNKTKEDSIVPTHDLWVSTVKYQDPVSKIFLGSPSLVKLSNGHLIATHDYFGPNRPKDSLGRSNRTSVYRSTDNGNSWGKLTDLDGMYWATLFVWKSNLYLLGTTSANGSIAIVKSTNNGETWSKASTVSTGLLFAEGANGAAPRYHCAPTPVVFHKGRLYKAFENIMDDTLPGMRGYRTFVISVDSDTDLLIASNWKKSNELMFNGEWDQAGSNATTGWLEGNIVEDTEGKLWNILRVNSTPFHSRAAMVKIENEGSNVTFDPSQFIHFPGGQCKFVIRKDPSTNLFWAMLNATPDDAVQRNILELHVSKDLKIWRKVKVLMSDNQGYSSVKSIELTGFQYPDWQFDGEDLIYLVRTSYGQGATRAHDANRITFGRLSNYRAFIPEL